jgi:hypothetical protein
MYLGSICVFGRNARMEDRTECKTVLSNTFNSEASRKTLGCHLIGRRQLAGLTLGYKFSNQILDGITGMDSDNEGCPEGLLIVSCNFSVATYVR